MFTYYFREILNLFVIIIIINFSIRNIQADECDKLIIEGGSNAVKQIFRDFNEMKMAISELKSSFHEHRIANVSRDLPQLDLRYDELTKKCFKEKLPKDCAEATACTQRSGIYKIQIDKYSFEPFFVECDAETDNGDWLLIQRRQDGSVDFLRNWNEYENGFGDVDGEFFIGLKKLYVLTNFNGPQELLIIMEDDNATRAFAKYDTFSIGNDIEFYKLKRIGKFTGNAGDGLKYHLGMKFTTKDRDNDIDDNLNCAENFTGAWWYKNCHSCNLNGKYDDKTYGKGVVWSTWRGHYSPLKYTKMMIRRRRSSI